MLNYQTIRNDWEYFQSTVRPIRTGDTDALRRAKDRLGYSLSELVPYLLDDLATLGARLTVSLDEVTRLNAEIRRSEKELKAAQSDLKQLAGEKRDARLTNGTPRR